ncbi:2-amino-4-hydroxy-6-hydroxymethyldihydropteridinepyrophosphokinase [Thalassovita gelatinovora]|uniref:2-amino-4-hydroxy-6-hydroxymethyldihydropteridine pyrophosphokinase n=1 Tax=Thalassovita gelatinovora TaxID=53501 RepID=A0A0P1FDJ0_THAGE|nr:2-amino-4-hydroxy-6-hydroxymethyldihydropteridine diphosphokinase [Thalassovita gelatinovora]QIZ81460.1 2-amino-4-hydroxy-6-hydroxymethyldihydropteridine diphosphokinase [Thalassovita gelatinovora]CUH66284.1 2-amino-4-hydroxy-6-hydroxymethyldihydropteridinepyrophosphokinase [Thalassovita gelatinovora]SEQ23012.1 2-amino-4-hydroxy-6-hydroxymethyldihydropteridinediphosphokinase [Thalassovita gelatinovora]
MDATQDILIAFGANLPLAGELPEVTLRKAIAELPAEGVEIVEKSRLFITPCFPEGAGPDYVNGALRCRTEKTPVEILSILHKVEERFGRKRPMAAGRWAGRTLDLDLIAVGNHVLPDRATVGQWIDLPISDQMTLAPEQLILPHPRIQDRAFVLVPLCEVAAGWKHPILGKSVAELCAQLPKMAKNKVVAV